MKYQRPVSNTPLSKEEKLDMLDQSIQHYQALAANDIGVLNRKVSRETSPNFLNKGIVT